MCNANVEQATFVPQLQKYVLIAEAKEPHMGNIFASSAVHVEGTSCCSAQLCFFVPLSNLIVACVKN
jgi:hypothetical protein